MPALRRSALIVRMRDLDLLALVLAIGRRLGTLLSHQAGLVASMVPAAGDAIGDRPRGQRVAAPTANLLSLALDAQRFLQIKLMKATAGFATRFGRHALVPPALATIDATRDRHGVYAGGLGGGNSLGCRRFHRRCDICARIGANRSSSMTKTNAIPVPVSALCRLFQPNSRAIFYPNLRDISAFGRASFARGVYLG